MFMSAEPSEHFQTSCVVRLNGVEEHCHAAVQRVARTRDAVLGIVLLAGERTRVDCVSNVRVVREHNHRLSCPHALVEHVVKPCSLFGQRGAHRTRVQTEHADISDIAIPPRLALLYCQVVRGIVVLEELVVSLLLRRLLLPVVAARVDSLTENHVVVAERDGVVLRSRVCDVVLERVLADISRMNEHVDGECFLVSHDILHAQGESVAVAHM